MSEVLVWYKAVRSVSLVDKGCRHALLPNLVYIWKNLVEESITARFKFFYYMSLRQMRQDAETTK